MSVSLFPPALDVGRGGMRGRSERSNRVTEPGYSIIHIDVFTGSGEACVS
jgi:hypothetical protein